jgi:hypothetical protein
VLSDTVFVKGSLDTLERVEQGLLLYVNGAVRAPSFPVLLDRLRSRVDHGEDQPPPTPEAGS